MQWLLGHTKPVRAVAYLPDGRLASGGQDGTVCIWRPTTGELLHTVRAPSVVYAVAASPDGTELVYSGRGERWERRVPEVCVCDPNTGIPVPHFNRYRRDKRGEHGSNWSLTYSADGLYLVAVARALGAGGYMNGLFAGFWRRDMDLYRRYVRVEAAYTARFAPDGRRLAVTHRRAVSVFDDPSAEAVTTDLLPVDWAADVAFVCGGLVVAAGRYLYLVRHPGAGRRKRVKTGILGLTALAVRPDGTQFLAAGRPGVVELYDAVSVRPLVRYEFDTGKIHAAAFAPDGLTFALAADNGVLVCDAT